jgi:hypothetical protein
MPFDPISLSEKRSKSSKYYKYSFGLQRFSFATLGQIPIFDIGSSYLIIFNSSQRNQAELSPFGMLSSDMFKTIENRMAS